MLSVNVKPRCSSLPPFPHQSFSLFKPLSFISVGQDSFSRLLHPFFRPSLLLTFVFFSSLRLLSLAHRVPVLHSPYQQVFFSIHLDLDSLALLSFFLMADQLAAPPPATPISPVSSFPILAISLIGMLLTTIILVGYYLIVLKCCLNWRRSDQVSHLSDSQFRRLIIHVDQLHDQQGLDEKLIRAIPTVRFNQKTHLLQGCAICLCDFRDGDFLRRIPTCSHHFHVGCIDIWLKNSGNCPICRSECSAVVEEGILEQNKREMRKGESKGDESIDIWRGSRQEGDFVLPLRRSVSMNSLCTERRERRVGFWGPETAAIEGSVGGASALRQPLFCTGGSSRSAENRVRFDASAISI